MTPASERRRLDLALVDLGLVESRARAQALILAGRVLVDGEPARRADRPVSSEQHVSVSDDAPVSRGAHKLAAALDAFAIEPAGRTCADVGASTGGFTEVLLSRGAVRVFAIDVGYGQLAWKLREDPRVTVMDRTNARDLATLPEPVSLVVVDVSFISLRLILPRVRDWLADGADTVVLFKPQFEVGRGQVGSGGVVRDPEARETSLAAFSAWCEQQGWDVTGHVESPITGQKGNVEFLAWLRQRPVPRGAIL
ncbi:MAG: TlyA family RNA methyltransferase [Candidatus Dormibacteria bacterium]